MKLLRIALFLCFSVAAFGQSSSYYGVATSPKGLPLASQTVAVCTQPANTTTTPCSPLATLATSLITSSGGTNPLTTDALGNYHFYTAPGAYTVQIYGPQVSTPLVQTDVVVGINGSGNNTFTGSNTFSGAVTGKQLNNALHVSPSNPQGWGGATPGDWVNSAFASAACNNACPIIIDSGAYSTGTTINYPVVVGGTASLTFDAGALWTYTGSGDAIAAIPSVANNAANVMIRGAGASLIGTSAAANGIHLKAFNVGRIEDLEIRGFSGSSAAGILNEGANVITIVGTNVRLNYYGLREVGVCSFLSGNYSPNALMQFGGHYQNNTQWGIYEDGTQAGCAGVNNSNYFISVTAEGNGTNGVNTTGNVWFQQCVSCGWITGYMEEPASLVVASPFQLGDATRAASRTQIYGGILNSTGATNSINLVNADNTMICGVHETLAVTNFVNLGASTIRTNICPVTFAPNATNYITGTVDFNSVIFNANNKLGIGVNPRGQAEINMNGAAPDALNANLANGLNVTDGSNTGMSMGFSDSGTLRGWIQARNNVGANNTAYPLALEPLGAPVVIGQSTNNGTDELQVTGSIQSTTIVKGAQVIANQGSVCTNGELALSAGWQSTGSATVTGVAGTGQTCSWTLTTGTTTAANPTVTDTLTNALPAATTRCWMFLEYGPASTHTAAAGEGFAETTLSATAPIFTFNGTPTAAGKTYLVVRTCGP